VGFEPTISAGLRLRPRGYLDRRICTLRELNTDATRNVLNSDENFVICLLKKLKFKNM